MLAFCSQTISSLGTGSKKFFYRALGTIQGPWTPRTTTLYLNFSDLTEIRSFQSRRCRWRNCKLMDQCTFPAIQMTNLKTPCGTRRVQSVGSQTRPLHELLLWTCATQPEGVRELVFTLSTTSMKTIDLSSGCYRVRSRAVPETSSRG